MNHPNRKMSFEQKVAKAERELAAIERKLDRTQDVEKVVKLSEAWDKANDRLDRLAAYINA